MLKVKDLINKEKCQYRSFLDGQNLESSKGKHYYNAIALKKIIEQFTIEELTDENKVKNFLEQYLVEDMYISKFQRENDINIFIKHIVRYATWEMLQSRKVLRKGFSHSLKFNNEIISVSADIIVENLDGSIEIIKFKRKKPDLKLRGRVKDTDPKQNIELYLMQKSGEDIYPDKVIRATFIYLINISDKDEILSEFEYEKGKVCNGKNVISIHFEKDDMYSNDIEERINNIIGTEINSSSKKCDGKECEICQYSNLCLYNHIDNSKLEIVEKIEKAKEVHWTYNQKRFIKLEEGFCRLNCVAGSGKTTVNAKRTIDLIKNKFYVPKDFLLITFTEKGVKELKEKIAYWIDIENVNIDINDITIMTFNGFGYDLIKKEYASLGFTKEPEILDKLDKYEIISDILNSEDRIPGLNYSNPLMNFFNAKGAVVKTSEIIQLIKDNGLVYPEELAEFLKVGEEFADRMFGVYLKFKNKLKEMNFVEYQDQIDMCIKILSNKDMIEKYGYKHIVVDEFQDTNTSQMYILQKLAEYSEFVSLVGCGDDAQAIFSWRGGTQENILKFHEYFPGTVDYFLRNNFRSTRQISRLANQLNELNSNKIEKEIISERDGEAPVIKQLDNNDIVKYIKEQIARGVPMYEIGVIARTKAQLLRIESDLKKEGIPCLVAVTELLRDNDKVNNIIGFSNFLVDNKLELHFAELLQVIKYEEFLKITNIKKFISTEKEKFLKEYENLKDKEKVDKFYELLEPLGKQDRAVERLLQICKEKDFKNVKELNNFLVKIKLYESELAIEKDDCVYNAVVLSTTHASKGREFEVVVALMDEYKYSLLEKDIETTEEERRLLMVAITRAKENLLLTYEKGNGFVVEVTKILF